jgi:hypothetical protein
MSVGLGIVGGCGRNRTAVDGFAGRWVLFGIRKVQNKPRKKPQNSALAPRYLFSGVLVLLNFF